MGPWPINWAVKLAPQGLTRIPQLAKVISFMPLAIGTGFMG